MSELYRSWQSSHQCLTHYVTTMPSQLYYAMQNFVNREKFPHGSFRMSISFENTVQREFSLSLRYASFRISEYYYNQADRHYLRLHSR